MFCNTSPIATVPPEMAPQMQPEPDPPPKPETVPTTVSGVCGENRLRTVSRTASAQWYFPELYSASASVRHCSAGPGSSGAGFPFLKNMIPHFVLPDSQPRMRSHCFHHVLTGERL
ncbi:hypothetical protein GSbR_14440 [Geobacter sp. SVR]|nr:hypothetical protein GSbR_14440 [Geobacter sp. SVR]